MPSSTTGTTRKCAIPSCTARCGSDKLMCSVHWRRVRTDLQKAIYLSFQARNWVEHRRLREIAIAEVVAGEVSESTDFTEWPIPSGRSIAQ